MRRACLTEQILYIQTRQHCDDCRIDFSDLDGPKVLSLSPPFALLYRLLLLHNNMEFDDESGGIIMRAVLW